jgi:pyruvate dehydrogenase E2 component (dihydrolipoamide acetyltransferase)
MAEVILMPRLSDTMTEGVIAEWHKKVGDPVKKGELLAEIETDKATMELDSYKEGTLLHIGADKGAKLQVNDLLAIIGAPGEDISNLIKDQGAGDKAQGTGIRNKTQGTRNKAQVRQRKKIFRKKKRLVINNKLLLLKLRLASQHPALLMFPKWRKWF